MRLNLSILLACVCVFGLIVLACEGNASSAPDVAVKTSDSPVPEATPNDAATAQGIRKVTIASIDKLPLAGTFFESSTIHSPAVLLLHQYGSDRHAYDYFATRLQAKGFNVLSIDGRGFGESVKTADGKTIGPSRSDETVKAMNGDVAAAFEFLAKQQNVDDARIGIVGASYGSSLAIIYAAENPKVKAVALLSPGTNYFGNMPTKPAVEKFGDRPLYLIAALDDKESAVAVEMLNPFEGNHKKHLQTNHPFGGHGTALLKLGATEELEDFLSKSL